MKREHSLNTRELGTIDWRAGQKNLSDLIAAFPQWVLALDPDPLAIFARSACATGVMGLRQMPSGPQVPQEGVVIG
ncbi:MAG: hypothetical protein HPM95_11860 [Alphaproteobacteria bacterium]|nr:hypothetical protein [Alphaproteobacteria bacterium]